MPRRITSRGAGRGRAPSLPEALRRVRLFLCDVDGILTDATVWIGDGAEFKCFNIQDGLGLKLLQRAGIRVGWVSSRNSPATTARAAELGIDFLHQVKGGKVEAVESILRETGLGWPEVCYMGDDIVDLGVLKRAGLPVSVPNGVPEARALALHVTRAAGGHGAVREMAERILKARKKWAPLVAAYEA